MRGVAANGKKSVKRSTAVRVLEAIRQREAQGLPWTPTDLAVELGAPMATVRTAVLTMRANGVLRDGVRTVRVAHLVLTESAPTESAASAA